MRAGKWLKDEELGEIYGFGVIFCAHGKSTGLSLEVTFSLNSVAPALRKPNCETLRLFTATLRRENMVEHWFVARSYVLA